MITVDVVIITENNFQLPTSYFQPLIQVSLTRTQVKLYTGIVLSLVFPDCTLFIPYQ